MDSLTQIVLGSAVGEAVLGKKIGNRALLWGAVAGTIPDFDVLAKFFVDPITNTEMHRGFSHSILFSVLFAPLFAYLIKRYEKLSLAAFSVVLVSVFFFNNEGVLAKGLSLSLLAALFYSAYRLKENRVEASWKDWTKLMFLGLITHPMLDAHTTWGTQFFWPFDYRLAFKNIFVVDPMYTIPFLICVIAVLFYNRENPKRRKWNNAGLIISSTYMLLTFVSKGVGYTKFQDKLDASDVEYIEMDTKPTPLNAVLWNAQVETETGYLVSYYSLLDSKPIEFSEEIKKNHHLLDPYRNQKVVKQLLKIAAGWYYLEKKGSKLFFYDIRFGQNGVEHDSPFFWKYELTEGSNGKITVSKPRPDMKNVSKTFGNLMGRIMGN